MPKKRLKTGKTGRPGLTDKQQAVIREQLEGLTPKTEAFREKRATLARRFKRTERNIDQYYAALVGTAEADTSDGPCTNVASVHQGGGE